MRDISGPTMHDPSGLALREIKNEDRVESNKDQNTSTSSLWRAKQQDPESIPIQPQSLKRNWRSQVKYI